MQVHSNIEEGQNFEEFLLSCRSIIERLARKFVASGYSLLDFDDYVSVASLKLWEVRDTVLAAETPMLYAAKVAERAMVDEYNKLHKISTRSLDAPLGSESSFCLADTLAEKTVSVSRTSYRRGRTMRGAVRRLPRVSRRAVKHFYGLEGVGLHTGSQLAGAMRTSYRNAKAAVRHGRKLLRSDESLRKLVGVEVEQ